MIASPHQVVCFGEVLWDVLPDKALPGGAPMNVAYHLRKLGLNPALITRIGLDDYGKKLVKILSDSGVDCSYFQVDYDQPTGLVYAHPNELNEVVYDIVQPSAWDFIQWDEEFVPLVRDADFFVYGSLTSRSKASRETLFQLLDTAKQKVLDINLRPPHYHRSQVELLLSSCTILKVNLAELELITGWFSDFEKPADRIKKLQEQFSINTVIVTMGGDGAMVSHDGNIHEHPGFKVEVADTIGSGDAFLAGFLSQLIKGASAEQALTYASALGAFIATQSGACPEYIPAQVEQLLGASQHQKT